MGAEKGAKVGIAVGFDVCRVPERCDGRKARCLRYCATENGEVLLFVWQRYSTGEGYVRQGASTVPATDAVVVTSAFILRLK